MVSTESSKQRLTFLLDRQFFCFAALRPRFHVLPEKSVRFGDSHSPTPFFLLLRGDNGPRYHTIMIKQYSNEKLNNTNQFVLDYNNNNNNNNIIHLYGLKKIAYHVKKPFYFKLMMSSHQLPY